MERRYQAPEHAMFAEVGHGGGGRDRYADAIVMCLWASRGHRVMGFEFKQDRRDWLRELKDPSKAETFASMCDEWWLVTTDNVVKDEDEVPETWGWLYLGPKAQSLKVKRKPERKSRADRPDIPRGFMAALIRRSHEFSQRRPEINAAREEGYIKGHADGTSKRGRKDELAVAESQARALQMEVDFYKQATKEAGMDFKAWDYPQIAKYVKMLQRVDPRNLEHGFRQALRSVQGIGTSLEAALKELEEPDSDTQ